MIKEEISYERQRVLMAEELRIPPDDLDLASILGSSFRAIRESCESENDDIMITIKDKKEEEAVFCSHGQEVVNRIFGDQSPLENIARDYERWYISILNNIEEGDI